jgi:hypothetical protein
LRLCLVRQWLLLLLEAVIFLEVRLFWVWGGDLPSPLTPSVIAAPAVGVVIFKADDNRCRGIVVLSNCACVAIGCNVVLHQRVDRKAPLAKDVAYICRSGPSKTVHITPALAMSDLPS